MVNRRSFLVGSGAIALGQLLGGCGDRARASLRVQLLNGSLPQQLIREFRTLSGSPAKFTPIAQFAEVLQSLQDWQEIAKGEKNAGWFPDWVPFAGNPIPPTADLVTLGDAWLAGAIRDRLIQPLTSANLEGWSNLPPAFSRIVTRNNSGFTDEKGAVWGAPYRWGTTMIAYNREVFKNLDWTPQDWGDLWREELRDRISIIWQPREIIGIVLKRLGYSYNTRDLRAIKDLRSELEAFLAQIKFYSSRYYLKPLVLKDTWVAVGWSGDILPTIERYPQIEIVVPPSGTALWCDVWVKPQASETKMNLSDRWIDFCWQDEPARKISQFTDAVSPMLVNAERSQLPKSLQNNSPLFPDREIFEKSEFLEPLSATVLGQYQHLLQLAMPHKKQPTLRQSSVQAIYNL
ncbi:MAG: substrate-binding domain-containing protein [Cyanobacteria bacterium P01_E01_bin.42]